MPGETARQNGKLGGRPKATATLRTQMFRELFARHMKKKFKKYVDALDQMALGHWVAKETTVPDPADPTGKKKIKKIRAYYKEPNVEALREAMRHSMGNPITPITGPDGEAAEFIFTFEKDKDDPNGNSIVDKNSETGGGLEVSF